MNIGEFMSRYEKDCIPLLERLCAIPAPSGREIRRAEFCKAYLEGFGAKGVFIDEACNCLYPVGVEGAERIVILMAHTDTVFPDLEPLPQYRKGDRLYCPGVGDDTANVALLLLFARYVTEEGMTPNPGLGVIFAFNAGEEGLGNLKGAKAVMGAYEGRVDHVISFDGYYTGLTQRAVGSTRYRVTLHTEGGHSYGNFGNRNAIHLMSALIQTLYNVRVPREGNSRTTYNVGTITGGTSINSIAQSAQMLYEYRSDSALCLRKMKRAFDSIISAYRSMGIRVEVKVIGERPGMGEVDPKRQEALIKGCAAAIERVTGRAPEQGPGSTDCNIPLSMGVPAVCFGLCTGAGAHTREEYVNMKSLPVGLRLAAEVMGPYFE